METTDLKPVVIIDGFTASGSSSIANRIAQTLDLQRYSSGQLFRQLCIEKGYCPKDLHAPDFNEKFVYFAKNIIPKNPQFDLEIDNRFLELVKNTNRPLLAEGRTTAALVTQHNIPVIVKVWITASIEDRVFRYRSKFKDKLQDKYTDEQIKQILTQKDTLDRERYLKIYNIDLLKPELYNDIVLDTTGQTLDASYSALINHPVFRERIKKLFEFYPDYGTSIIRWKCLECGYVYEGFVPVHMCPRCGNINPDKFQDLIQ